MKEITLLMPYPPSLNGLFTNVPGRGRVPTRRYAEWRERAGAWLIQHNKWGTIPSEPIAAEFKLTTRLNPPDKRRRDLDNVGAKAILDILKSWEIIADDSLASEIRMLWDRENVTPGAALITLEVAS